jgi:hypothetical protein
VNVALATRGNILKDEQQWLVLVCDEGQKRGILMEMRRLLIGTPLPELFALPSTCQPHSGGGLRAGVRAAAMGSPPTRWRSSPPGA